MVNPCVRLLGLLLPVLVIPLGLPALLALGFVAIFILGLVLRAPPHWPGCLASDGAVVVPPACLLLDEACLERSRAVSRLLPAPACATPPFVPLGTHRSTVALTQVSLHGEYVPVLAVVHPATLNPATLHQ